MYTIIYNTQKIGLWEDYQNGYIYASDKTVENTLCYALTSADNTINYIAARKAEPALKALVEFYHIGILRYTSHNAKQKMLDVLRLYGVK